mmetsp:Transcript_4634/g.8786  ORF Transcript_4634/g.8786 Transcript_4634/m.8786 type:complete len:333 (+) Transcript_4634:62-1060(+)
MSQQSTRLARNLAGSLPKPREKPNSTAYRLHVMGLLEQMDVHRAFGMMVPSTRGYSTGAGGSHRRDSYVPLSTWKNIAMCCMAGGGLVGFFYEQKRQQQGASVPYSTQAMCEQKPFQRSRKWVGDFLATHGGNASGLMNPSVLVESLKLIPHPEGGYFRETYRSGAPPMASQGASDKRGTLVQTNRPGSERNIMTSIYWLLNQDSPVGWWCSNASDHIHYYHGGAGITYMVVHPDGRFERQRCGPDVANGDVLQFEVKGGCLKCCTIGDAEFTLIGEAVAPGFDFRDFTWVTEEALEAALVKCDPQVFQEVRQFVKPEQRRDFKTWYAADKK